jgi:hypothetical protein
LLGRLAPGGAGDVVGFAAGLLDLSGDPIFGTHMNLRG